MSGVSRGVKVLEDISAHINGTRQEMIRHCVAVSGTLHTFTEFTVGTPRLNHNIL